MCPEASERAQGQTAAKKKTVSCQVKQSAAWLSQASSLKLFSFSCAGPGALLKVDSHQDTGPAYYHRGRRRGFFPLCGQDKQLCDLMKAIRWLLYHKHWASAPTYPCLYCKCHTCTPPHPPPFLTSGKGRKDSQGDG